MRRFAILLGIAVLGVGLLACGGSDEEPAAPTLPPLATSAAPAPVAPTIQQPAPASQSSQQPSRADSAVNLAAEPPQQLRGEAAPLQPPWPTFTPGLEPQSDHRLIYARSRRFYTANADGSSVQALKFANESPQLLVTSYKDPGRGWMSPNGRYLLYFAGPQEAQLWGVDLTSLQNTQLAARMLSAGQAGKDAVRVLTEQNIAWTSDGTRAALIGMPDSADLFIADLTTGQLTRVTQDEWQEAKWQWSPGDRYLAYTATDLGSGTQVLRVWDVKTQQSTEVDVTPVREAFNLSSGAGVAFADQLVWVSDAQFVFYPQSNRRSAGIWLYDVASRTARPVLPEKIGASVWSAEARAWVYSKPDEPGALWLLRLDNPKPTLLVEGEAYAPVWSPDGRSVLYSWSDPETTGWDLRVVDLNGDSRTLVENVSLIQQTPSEPGPAGKRYWSPDGRLVLYSAVGRDYGRAEQDSGYGGQAGPDLENWWIVPDSGGQARRATDMQKIFYLQVPELSPDGTTWAYVGFSYTDRMQHLYTIPREGGHPERVDAGVRWFRWLPSTTHR